MTPTDELPPTSDEVLDEPVDKRWVWVIRLLILAVVVLLVLPVFSTLQPRYYERYSGMRVSMVHWSNSTHALMSCPSCHVEPGVKGFTSFATRSIPAFYSQLLQGPKRTNLLGAPGTVACLKCHTSFRKVSPEGDLRIPHKAHIKVLKINCVECHEKLVHFKNASGVNRPAMSLCLDKCHNGKKAKDKCVDCHTDKNTPETHKAPDWLKIHAEESKKSNCGTCHAWSKNYCNQCHAKRPSGHAGNWKKAHAIRAKVESKGCLVCHKQEFCKKCH